MDDITRTIISVAITDGTTEAVGEEDTEEATPGHSMVLPEDKVKVNAEVSQILIILTGRISSAGM
ncbi:hypothetical protein JYU34_004729 [Plutella xylostella]|uniref:Uncharacterized protein n=1 Tax=Plutella xylostella TaxID=51655 RepID=A0ABQ7QYP6_PLUXY|nr:hypothetical protein JYU34_004729 [Plutella xylostella]